MGRATAATALTAFVHTTVATLCSSLRLITLPALHPVLLPQSSRIDIASLSVRPPVAHVGVLLNAATASGSIALATAPKAVPAILVSEILSQAPRLSHLPSPQSRVELSAGLLLADEG